MEHHMEQAQGWGSYLTDTSSSQQSQLLSFQTDIEVALLCSESKGSQLDHEGASREVLSGRKRRGCKPSQTPQEKRKKKNEADRNYRKKHKEEFDKLRAIASRFGGVEKMEAELHRLWGIEREFHVIQQMKDRFGGIEEMQSKLHRLEQITSMLNLQNAESFFGSLQEQGYHGMQSVNFKYQEQGSVTEIDGLKDCESEMLPAAMSGTMPDLVYSDAHVTEFNAKLDENVMSNTCLSGFNDLLGECQSLEGYTVSQS